MISFEKSVGAIVFRKTEKGIKYLLLDYGNGYWGLPKGHVEKGESEIETLKREVNEETGISDLKINNGFRVRIRYFYRAQGEEKEKRLKKGRKTNIYKKAIFYLAETSIEDISLSAEHYNFEWLPYEKAMERINFKNTHKVLEKAKRFIDKRLAG